MVQSYYQPGEAGAVGKIGRLKRVEKTGVAATDYLTYDAMGRVLEMQQTITGAPAAVYGPVYLLSYQYYANGAVKQITYPAAASGLRRVVKYELDSVGRPVRVCNGNCSQGGREGAGGAGIRVKDRIVLSR